MTTHAELRKGIIDCAKATVEIDRVLSERLDALEELVIHQGRHSAELDQRLDRLELAATPAAID